MQAHLIRRLDAAQAEGPDRSGLLQPWPRPPFNPWVDTHSPRSCWDHLGAARLLQVSTLEAVALSAEQLQVVNCGGTAQGHRDDVIVLKIKFAAALGTLAGVSFEDCAADLTGDGLPLPLRPWLVAFVER